MHDKVNALILLLFAGVAAFLVSVVVRMLPPWFKKHVTPVLIVVGVVGLALYGAKSK